MKNLKQNQYEDKWCNLYAIIATMLVALFLCSCYTQDRAIRQVEKANDKYPVIVAKKTRDWFPCITTEFDSSVYVSSIKDLNNTLAAYDSSLTEKYYSIDTLTSLIWSYRKRIDEGFTNECDSINESLYRECAKSYRQNEDLKSTILQLRKNIENIKPVIKYVSDDSKIFIAREEANKARYEANKSQAQYDTEKELRQALQKKWKGKIGIPWWVFAILGVLIGVSIKFRWIRLLTK